MRSSYERSLSRSESVRVAVRARPLNATEKAVRSLLVVEAHRQNAQLLLQHPVRLPGVSSSRQYTFDKVFDPDSSNEEVLVQHFDLLHAVGCILYHGPARCHRAAASVAT